MRPRSATALRIQDSAEQAVEEKGGSSCRGTFLWVMGWMGLWMLKGWLDEKARVQCLVAQAKVGWLPEPSGSITMNDRLGRR